MHGATIKIAYSTVIIKKRLFTYVFKNSVSIFDNILKAECRIQRLE